METENTVSIFMPTMRYDSMNHEMWELWNHAVGEYFRICCKLENLKNKDKKAAIDSELGEI